MAGIDAAVVVSRRITLACDSYDRTVALRTGDVRAHGVDLNYLAMPVEETFHRMVKHREFDVAELSLSSYVLTLDQEHPPFIAIPVFPSRSFRHSGIYVNSESGITSPGDLVGRTVGVPEYQVTAAVWIRGILAEYHDVAVDSVLYRTGGIHQAGRAEKLPLALPPSIDISPIADGKTLAQMLVSGEIDALYSPRTPRPFDEGNPAVRRLFANPRAAEQKYFTESGVFPVMHVIAIRREVYEADRWLARSLFDAFCAAKDMAMKVIDETTALRYMVPWLAMEVADTRAIMGNDYWGYGVDEKDPTIARFLDYSHQQGLAQTLRRPEDIFAPETLDAVLV